MEEIDDTTWRSLFELLIIGVFLAFFFYFFGQDYILDSARAVYSVVDVSFGLTIAPAIPGMFAVKMPIAYNDETKYIVDKNNHIINLTRKKYMVEKVIEKYHQYISNNLLGFRQNNDGFIYSKYNDEIAIDKFELPNEIDCKNPIISKEIILIPNIKEESTIISEILNGMVGYKSVRKGKKTDISEKEGSVFFVIDEDDTLSIKYNIDNLNYPAYACIFGNILNTPAIPMNSSNGNIIYITMPNDKKIINKFIGGISSI